MNDIEAFLLDVAGNIVGNKLTDIDKERMLKANFQLLLEIRERLSDIERKLDRIDK